MQVRVREQRLPGVGQRYEFDVSPGRRVVVIATPDGGRRVGVAADGVDEMPTLGLTADQATMLGALLLGAKFSIDVSDDPAFPADTVQVDTIVIPEGAPSVGLRPSEVMPFATSEAQVLGVIRDGTPELVELDRDEPLRAGDRVAMAARADRLGVACRRLTG